MVCVFARYFCRLQQLSGHLSERETELDKLHEQLQAEVSAAAAKAAAQEAELAGERGLMAKQSAALDKEREEFKAWCAERKQEMARQHKVGWSCLLEVLWKDHRDMGFELRFDSSAVLNWPCAALVCRSVMRSCLSCSTV